MTPEDHDAPELRGPDPVADGVWSIALPVRDADASVASTHCYLIRDADNGIHVIDPGVDDAANRELLRAALARLGAEVADIRSLVATHLHRDHLGAVPGLAAESGAEIVLHRVEQEALDRPVAFPSGEQLDAWGVPAGAREGLRPRRGPARIPVRADRLVDDGDLLPVAGRRIRVLWTPGHTAGHICLVDEDRALVFTGDHVLPHLNPGIGLGGPADSNPIADYLASLDRVAAFAGFRACPGHGHPFADLPARCRELAAHHRRRTAEVAEIVARDPAASVFEIARKVAWTGGWESLRGVALASALAQTELHRALAASGEGAARAL